MRKILFLLVVGLIFFHQTTFAIGLGGSTSVKFCGNGDASGKEHVHVTTRASRVYTFTVTAIADGGFAQLIETKDAGTDETNQLLVSKGILKADVVIATANDTVSVPYSDMGVGIGGQLFLDCSQAIASVEYRD